METVGASLVCRQLFDVWVGFNRVSWSLWFLLNKMLAIPCGVFYDNFPMFQPESLSEDADLAASQRLDLLGWKHAKIGTSSTFWGVHWTSALW